MTTVAHWARQRPGAVALRLAGGGPSLTYAELDARSNRVAQLFRTLGLRRGDHVAWMVPNGTLCLELLWGAHRSGLVYTPVSTHLSAGDAAYIVNDCDAQVFITTGAHALLAPAIAHGAPGLRHRFIAGGSAEGCASLEEALAAMPAVPIADESVGVDMNYSSGTTGLPKGVERVLPDLPFGDPRMVDTRLAARFGFGEQSRFLVPNPLYHSAPMRHSMLVQMLGGEVVVMERFDAEAALAAIDAHRITHALFVPTMFVRLLALPEAVRARYRHDSLQRVTHAAAACPVAVKQRMIDWWGPIVTELYGNTEECGFTAIGSAEWAAHPGSIGRPTVGRFHVLDDAGQELGPREVGTLWVEGARPFRYYKDEAKTAASRHAQGWQTVGDNGWLDEDGYVYLTDRASFTINSGGVKISPHEVEEALRTHPAVQDAAVFGVPDPEFGEQVKAVVQLHAPDTAGPALEAELIAHCRGMIAKLKAPRSVEFIAELPRNALGKLMKKELRARHWPAREELRP